MNPTLTNLSHARAAKVGITGAGAADPTKRYGAGVTVTWQATGVYRFSFARHLGTLLGIAGFGFGADTPSAVKGYTVTRDTQVAPASGVAGYVDVSVWDSSFAAADLATAQYLDLTFEFTESSSDLA